ncbi:hypothetical protein PWT90_02200 [Aphanocladium album]|nr:hypothetical protein PWT90_02200 [Aphanocladium album]
MEAGEISKTESALAWDQEHDYAIDDTCDSQDLPADSGKLFFEKQSIARVKCSDAPVLTTITLITKGIKHCRRTHRYGARWIRSHAQRRQARMVLSPKTTRRNMLDSELPESLRRHLVRERQENSLTTDRQLDHTQFPDRPYYSKVAGEADICWFNWDFESFQERIW